MQSKRFLDLYILIIFVIHWSKDSIETKQTIQFIIQSILIFEISTHKKNKISSRLQCKNMHLLVVSLVVFIKYLTFSSLVADTTKSGKKWSLILIRIAISGCSWYLFQDYFQINYIYSVIYILNIDSNLTLIFVWTFLQKVLMCEYLTRKPVR